MDSVNKARQYNMDMARCLLIFMVIVLHYNNRGMGGALNYAAVGGLKEYVLRFSESLCICAVNSFLILSGYFAGISNSKPYKKAMWLLITCSFYRTVAYVLHAALVLHEFGFRTFLGSIIPSNWFVCLFVCVLLMSPYINRMLSGLEESALVEFVSVISGLFVLIPSFVRFVSDFVGIDISGITTISVAGDSDGFTIVSFVYCYCIGVALYRLKEKFDRIPGVLYFILFLITAVLQAMLSFKSEGVWSYSGILTVLEGVFFVLMFTRIRIENSRIGKLLSAVGGCGLGVFVWHTSPLMLYGFWVHFDISQIAQSSVGTYIVNLLAATVSMYLLSVVWVLICRKVSKPLAKMVMGHKRSST